MFTRIATMIRKDLRTGSRDQITSYILLSPILLGLMLALILPLIEDPSPTFAISEAAAQLDPDAAEALARHGELERLSDRAAVEGRVLQRDAASGVVVAESGGLEVLVEGDEPAEVRELAPLILEAEARRRAGVKPAALEHVRVGEGSAQLRLISTSLVAYTIAVMVGLMLGFTILEEKISETFRVYDVSPLRFGEYLLAKLGLGTLLTLVMIVPAVALPLGWDQRWWAIELTAVASLPFALSLGLIVGAVAKDQLASVGIMKGLLPVWTSLPILGFVLPARWMWTQLPFANHWGVQGMFHALGDGEAVVSAAALSLATGIPVLVATAAYLRHRLGFGRD